MLPLSDDASLFSPAADAALDASACPQKFRASLAFVSFVFLLYFLLSADEDVIDTTLNSLPVAPSSRATIEKSVR